jgi:hypothetical protein
MSWITLIFSPITPASFWSISSSKSAPRACRRTMMIGDPGPISVPGSSRVPPRAELGRPTPDETYAIDREQEKLAA